MPCRCDGYEEMDRQERQDAADKATRAACDMRTIIRRFAPSLENELTKETRRWIRGHDAADVKRIAEENAAGIREATRRRALDKLSLEERRVLGL